MTTTFVTAFYNLEKNGVKIAKYQHELSEYFRRIDFLLSVPGPLVIFTEQSFVDIIIDGINKYRATDKTGRPYQTQLVVKEWQYLYWVTRFNEISDICSRRSWMTRTEHDDSPEFIPVMWEKILLVCEVIKSEKYNTSHFAWIDFGLGRIPHHGSYQESLKSSSITKYNKIRFMMNNQQIFTEQYYNNDVQVSTCAAGFITGTAEYFNKLLPIFLAEADKCLRVYKCCPREETILSKLTIQHPELFDVYYGDENGFMLTNYSGFYFASELLITNLNRLLQQNFNSRIMNVCENVLKAFDSGSSNANSAILFLVLQALLISSIRIKDYEKQYYAACRFKSFLAFDSFKALYETHRAQIDPLLDEALSERPEISIVCLIYKSVKYLQFVYDQVHKYTPQSFDFFFIANDASEEVLAYLKEKKMKHFVYTNTPENIRAHGTTESYLNNVYRAWNFGASQARGKYIVFINSDMAFSPGWLEGLMNKAIQDENVVVTSRLLESGRYPSGTHGKTFDCGKFLRDYNETKFLNGAEAISENITKPDGLYMPLLIRREDFISVGGYPEGNIQSDSVDIFNPKIAKKSDIHCIPGDQCLMMKLNTLGIKHVTAFDSIVYHFQNGEMFE